MFNTENMKPVAIDFLFKDPEYADKAMQCFNRWVEASDNDGDAVSIDFIEHINEGYTICIYQEVNKLIDRVVPKYLKDFIIPIPMSCAHFKGIEKKSSNFENFKNGVKNNQIYVGALIGKDMKPVKRVNGYFQKSNFNFYHESNIPDTSMAFCFYGINRSSKDKPAIINKREFPKVSIDEIKQYRTECLQTFYPITFERVKNQNWLNVIVSQLIETYDIDVIIQSICNLILSQRIKKEDSINTIKNVDINPTDILDYLICTPELLSSFKPDDSFFSKEKIEDQIGFDTEYLQNYLKEN